MINDNCNIEKYTHPFPYVKISNFLKEEVFDGLEKNFPRIENFQKSSRSVQRMDFDTTYGDKLYNDLINNHKFYQLFHNFVYSVEFVKYFINIFKDDIKNEYNLGFLKDDIEKYKIEPEPYEVGGVISKKDIKKNNTKFMYPRLDIGAGIEGYGKNSGGKGIHIDNPQRLISVLFYLGGYKKIDGGEHRIWKKNDKNNLEIHESIKPEKNLLIAGLQNNLAFHDVNPVNSVEGSRNAFYLAISCSLSIWKDVKSDNFNLKYNKNRVRLNLFNRIKNKFF